MCMKEASRVWEKESRMRKDMGGGHEMRLFQKFDAKDVGTVTSSYLAHILKLKRPISFDSYG